MEEYAFNLFREVDKLFDTKSVNTSKFYNDNKVSQYCPKQDGYTSCYSDYQRINAIGTYVFMELYNKNRILNGMNDERHLSYFIMWMSHILYRKFEDNTFTLNYIYNKHLKNNFGNFNYWNLLHNKKYLTNSNIAIMNVLYFLFQQILDTIKTIQTKDIQSHEYTSKSLEFYVIYNKIFKHINPCGPYRELLNRLKTIYNEFIKNAKNKYANREDVLNQLIELSPNEKSFGNKFNSKGCIKIHKKLNNNTSKLIKIGNSMLKDYAEKKIQNTPDLINSQDTKFYYYYGFDDDDVNGGDGVNGGDDVNSGDDAIDDDDDENGDLRNNGITINSSNQEQNGQQGASIVSKPASENSPPTPPQAPQKSGTSPRSEKTDSDIQKGNSDSEGGEKGDPDRGKGGTNNLSGSTGDGPGNGVSGGQVGTDSGTGSGKGGTKGESGSPGSVQNDQGGSPVGSGSQGGSSNQRGSDDRSKTSEDQVPTHPSGASSGYLPSILGTSFNLTSYMPSASGIYESSKNILTNTANKITSAYNSAMTIAQGTYDKTVSIAKNAYGNVVSTVKDTYTRSTDYISGAVNSITIQLNPFGSSQLGDNQPGSGGSGNSLPTDNNPSNTTQVPTQDPNLPSPPSPSPSLPPIPQSQLPSATSPPSQPQSNQPQGSSPSINPDPQTLSDPPSSKSLDPQTSSTLIQQTAPTNGNKAFQISPSGQGTLASSGSNSLNTKNENVISVANVKVKETSSIWCIGSNNKCDITGISIIVISISIILTIMYKYLSLGRTSKSKRKKSMKKVINSIGGKRPIQIIIKSYDRKKGLKPVINSVCRKKDPLLNIYKLMKADPVPFINVFFLLIFFVYKRQLNYLEL
ncbi:CIR protein PIR protein [Plasmodium vinckei brucechwatti]|uniref:CIR protein PIR protein n=1 Tax=Plasmodium vinckei brucechwatti TaxID=119398 RepID=A0A6V7RV00_PLAVN|nr:CIR protein PIR protein [Plasmodium vinckei brucechwatti]